MSEHTRRLSRSRVSFQLPDFRADGDSLQDAASNLVQGLTRELNEVEDESARESLRRAVRGITLYRAGLAPIIVKEVAKVLEELSGEKITILLVEQMVQEALEIAHRGYVIQSGKIVQSGTARELLDSEEVRKAYLGM